MWSKKDLEIERKILDRRYYRSIEDSLEKTKRVHRNLLALYHHPDAQVHEYHIRIGWCNYWFYDRVSVAMLEKWLYGKKQKKAIS